MERSTRHRIARVAAVVAVLLTSGPVTGSDLETPRASMSALLRDPGRAFVPGELIVKLAPGASRVMSGAAVTSGAAPSFGSASLDALATAHGVRRVRHAFRGFENVPGKQAEDRLRALRGAQASRSARAPRVSRAPELEDVFRFELDTSANLVAVAAAFAADPDVVYAEPSYLYTAFAEPLPALPLIPDDRFVTQDAVTWSEGAWAQDFPDLYGLRNTQAIEAWNDFDTNGDGVFGPGEVRPGEGVVVAIVDSGIDVDHPDLAGRIWVNPAEVPGNGVDDDANGFVDDVNGWDFVDADAVPIDGRGHGTHVAGTVAAAAGNAEGVAGLAPWAQVMAVRGLNSQGAGTSADLANSVVYAVDNGADILQNSWGGTSGARVIIDAFAYAHAAGVLSIAAAGNSSGDFAEIIPAAIDTVMAVAAVDHEDRRADFSNFGRGIDIAAPGVGVLSLNAQRGANGIATIAPERIVEVDYLWLNGTSMACPHAAAAAALLMTALPGETIEDLRGRLRAGAEPIDAENPGFGGLLGAGRLNLLASLRAEPGPVLQIVDAVSDPLVPGHSSELVLTVRNFWREATGVSATLVSHQPGVTVSRPQAFYGDLGQGDTSNGGSPFAIELSDGIEFGSDISLELALRDAAGIEVVLPLSFQVTFFHPVSKPGIPAVDFLPVNVRASDFDRDGDPDLVYVRFTDFGIYRNEGGRFEEVTRDVGVAEHGSLGRLAALFFDLTPGTYPDLFVGGNTFVGDFVYENRGWFSFFDDVTEAIGLAPGLNMISAIALDYDGNGTTDLFGGGALPRLLSNDGSGGLVDIAPGVGLDGFEAMIGQSAAFDYDQDGDLDIVVVSDESHTRLFRNDGAAGFADVASEAGLQHPLGRGFGLAVGDVDGDGWTDVLLMGLGVHGDAQRTRLFRNLGTGSFDDVTDAAGDLSGEGSGFLWGSAFFDFDHDGDLDLYMNTEGVGERPFGELFLNDGAGSFTRVTELAFPREVFSRTSATAIFDVDGDGDLDIFAPSALAAGGGKGALFENLASTGNALLLDLRPAGGGRDAWGARVVVTTGGVSRTREVVDSPLAPSPLHVGLAGATRADRVEIHWPDGSVQVVLGLRVNQRVEVVQGQDPCAAGPDSDGDGIANICDFTNDAPALGPAAQVLLIGLLGLAGWHASRTRS